MQPRILVADDQADILSALILPVTLALAFGWLLLAEKIGGGERRQRYRFVCGPERLAGVVE